MESTPTEIPLSEEIRALLRDGNEAALSKLLTDSNPADLAGALYDFGVNHQLGMLQLMATREAGRLFCELHHSTMEALLAEIDLQFLKQLIAAMEPDDAADTVGIMGQERADALLAMLPEAQRNSIAYLLTYDEDSAGGLMDPDVVRVQSGLTVKAAIEEVRRYVERVKLNDFFSLYVVDADGVLLGTVPNWKVLIARPGQTIEEIMEPTVVSVAADMDQEEISRLVRDHDLVSVPVVDEDARLIGRITHDDIVDVIDEEHEEDLGKLTGTMSEEVRELSVLHTIRLRFPWLFIALVGEFLLALFMKNNESFLAAVPQMAFFFPLIMAMGGTSGVQSSSLVIRGLATGEVEPGHWRRRLLREIVVSITIGTLFAGVLLLGGTAMTGNFRLAASVGLATMAGIMLAASGGTVIPIALKSLGFDPALATGPFITTLNDILGILVYLGIAYLVLV